MSAHQPHCRICASSLHAWAVSADSTFAARERLWHLYCTELAKFDKLRRVHKGYAGHPYGRQFFTGAIEQWIAAAALGDSLGILDLRGLS